MKVVSFSATKSRSIGKKEFNRHDCDKKSQRIEIKLPDLDPSLAQIIDYKNPVLQGREVQTNRDYRPASKTITRNINLEKRPKTVQAQTRAALQTNKGEEPLKRGAYYRPVSKMTQKRTNRHIVSSPKKIESIYYLRSKTQAMPYSEMQQAQNLTISRTIPSVLQPRDRPICFF